MAGQGEDPHTKTFFRILEEAASSIHNIFRNSLDTRSVSACWLMWEQLYSSWRGKVLTDELFDEDDKFLENQMR